MDSNLWLGLGLSLVAGLATTIGIVISTGIPMKSGCSGEICVRAERIIQSQGRFLDFASLRSK